MHTADLCPRTALLALGSLLGCSVVNTLDDELASDAGQEVGRAEQPAGGSAAASGSSAAQPIQGDTTARVLDHLLLSGSDINRGFGIAVHGTDVYLTGLYKAELSYEGGVHVSDGEFDIHVFKLDAEHDEHWSRSFGGSPDDDAPGSFDLGLRVAVAGDDVLLLGACMNLLVLDAFTVCEAGPAGFVAKLDGANGSVIWARELPRVTAPDAQAVPRGLAADPVSGDVYVTGRYDIAYESAPGEPLLEELEFPAAYVLKLWPEGEVAWGQSVTSNGLAAGLALALAADGDVICSGFVTGVSALIDDPGGEQNSADAFVMRLSPTGERRFIIRLSGPGNDEASALASLEGGQVLVAGRFEGAIGIGDTELLSIGEARTGVYFARVDREGAAVAVDALGTGPEQDAVDNPVAAAVVALDDGFAVTGTFEDEISHAGELVLRADQDDDLYFARFSSQGLEWAIAIGGPLIDTARDMVLDADGNLLAIGHVTGKLEIAGAPVSTGGQFETLVVKLAP